MIIYLPVETSRREMVAKVFTATMLASKGYPVAVFKRDFFDANGWPGPGVYIGKNCFKFSGFGNEKYYDRMKQEGIRVWHLDEEGGVYPGNSESEWRKLLLRRLNPAALQDNDKILTWGQWQQEAFLELDPKCPVCVTGSPNFDVCRPAYSQALAAFDEIETDGRKNYILVNTRCALSNGLISITGHLEEDSQVSQHFDQRSLRHWISESGMLQFSFISLVQKLSESLPDDEIVLRPHPAEDPNLYRQLLEGFANVSVEWRGDAASWIRRCRALIHNGCTTAIQAQIAEKPVITYLPISGADGLSPGLPNLIGEKCRSVSAVMEALESTPTAGDHEALSRTISKTEAIKEIVAMVERECAPPVGGDVLDQVVANVQKASRRGKFLHGRKRLKRQLLRKKVSKSKGKKFDAGFFGRASELYSAARRHLGCEVEFLTPHAECYLFMPRRPG